MQEINFGMDGLSLDGTVWYNAKTGDSFKVRSNFFEDNNMILQTTDGRRINLDKMDGYVQWQGSGQPPKGPMEPAKPAEQPIPAEVLSELDNGDNPGGILPEDLALIQRIGKEQKQPQYKDSPALRPAPKTSNFDIIDRALKKAKTPDWSVVMKWNKFPEQELSLLCSVMDIPIEEIAEYYMGHIRDEFDEFMNSIRDQIGGYIQSKLQKEEQPTTTKSNSGKTKTKK